MAELAAVLSKIPY